MAGLEVGAFFILFYPGDTDETVLDTLHFTTTLPLDYLGLTLPYPLPGTALYERVRERITREWHPGESVFTTHRLTFDADFSETKMFFGLLKGQAQFKMKKQAGKIGSNGFAIVRKAHGLDIQTSTLTNSSSLRRLASSGRSGCAAKSDRTLSCTET